MDEFVFAPYQNEEWRCNLEKWFNEEGHKLCTAGDTFDAADEEWGLDVEEDENPDQQEEPDPKQIDVDSLSRLEDRSDVKAKVAEETRLLQEAIPDSADTGELVEKLDPESDFFVKAPKTLTDILGCVPDLVQKGSPNLASLLSFLEKIDLPMGRFTNAVRAAEGLVSPTGITRITRDLGERNFAVHQLALARQYSLISTSKRCSRAEAWASVQRKLGQETRLIKSDFEVHFLVVIEIY